MMKENRAQPLSICVDLKKYRIRVHKKALQAIGSPPYILLLVNPTEQALIIQSTDPMDRKAHHLSWAAAKTKSPFEIYSRRFVSQLQMVYGHWQENCTYRMYGKVVGNGTAIAYYMATSELITEQ